MPRMQVVRIPEELDKSIEDAASECGSTVEGFILFSVAFYLELLQGGFIVAHTQEKHQEFIRLAASGRSLRSIEGIIGVSHGTAVAWNRKYSGRICEMCSGDMDQVLEACAEAKNQRIAKLAQQISRVEEEVLTRDITEIPTASLMRLGIRYREQLRLEVSPVEVSVKVDSTTQNYLAILQKCAVIDE